MARKKRGKKKTQAFVSTPGATPLPAKRLRRGVNMLSLDTVLKAAAAVRTKPLPPRRGKSIGLPLGLKRTTPEVLKPKPRQTSLLKGNLRAPTVVALTKSATALKKDKRHMSKTLRDAICYDYRRDTKKRRQSMFAKGSAGKGRNKGTPQQSDWRKEFCK